ncbi:hypothetical protein STREPTOSP366_26640 [Streptomyces variabilis]
MGPCVSSIISKILTGILDFLEIFTSSYLWTHVGGMPYFKLLSL